MAIGFSTAAARHSDSSDGSLFSSVLRVRPDPPENCTLSSDVHARRNRYMATSSTVSHDRRESASLMLMMVLLITLSFLLLSLAPCSVIDVYEIYPQKLRSILFPSSSMRMHTNSRINLYSENSSRMHYDQGMKDAPHDVAEAFKNEYLQNIAHVQRLIHQEISREENVSRLEGNSTEGIHDGSKEFQAQNSRELENISGYGKTPSKDPIPVSHSSKLSSAKEETGVNMIKGLSFAVRGLFETNDQRIILQEAREQNTNIILERNYMQNERKQTDIMANDQTIMKRKREQIKNIVATLRKAGMFAMVATRIEAMDLLSLPQVITIFVPTDSAFDIFMNASNAYIPDHLLLYHLVVPRYTFGDLCGLKKRNKLTTYLMGCKITITENDLFNYTLDDVRIISPDLYNDDSVVVHGINGVLNYTRFCNIDDTNIQSSSPKLSGSSTSSNPVGNLPTNNPLLPSTNGSSLPSTAGSPGSISGVAFTHTRPPLAIRLMGFAGTLFVSFSSYSSVAGLLNS